MNNCAQKRLEELVLRYTSLEKCKDQIKQAFWLLENAFRQGGKMLVAGNGGSAADSEHIVGELMKGFIKERAISPGLANNLKAVDAVLGKELSVKLQGALPAISLVGHPGLSTAFLNDRDPVLGFAQQVNGLGLQGDVLFAISTSGNSQNIIYAAVTAKAKDMAVVGLTGRDGGKLKAYADAVIVVDEEETYKIQELHLPVYHTLCLMLEEEFFTN